MLTTNFCTHVSPHLLLHDHSGWQATFWLAALCRPSSAILGHLPPATSMHAAIDRTIVRLFKTLVCFQDHELVTPLQITIRQSEICACTLEARHRSHFGLRGDRRWLCVCSSYLTDPASPEPYSRKLPQMSDFFFASLMSIARLPSEHDLNHKKKWQGKDKSCCNSVLSTQKQLPRDAVFFILPSRRLSAF